MNRIEPPRRWPKGLDNMLKAPLALGLALTALISGCSFTAPGGGAASRSGTEATTNSQLTTTERCQVLGGITADAACDCYDEFSYSLLRKAATRALEAEAAARYPESNQIEVSSIELYMNTAEAHGTAYRCDTPPGLALR
jgi:hypothetical protein